MMSFVSTQFRLASVMDFYFFKDSLYTNNKGLRSVFMNNMKTKWRSIYESYRK
jgi:hypothetical protein